MAPAPAGAIIFAARRNRGERNYAASNGEKLYKLAACDAPPVPPSEIGVPHAPELISARFLFKYLTAFKDELVVSQMIGSANVSLSVGKISEMPACAKRFKISPKRVVSRFVLFQRGHRATIQH
jgi:hypothetical protein